MATSNWYFAGGYSGNYVVIAGNMAVNASGAL
jgi:hypothetical protein